jgi:hypothetical protein
MVKAVCRGRGGAEGRGGRIFRWWKPVRGLSQNRGFTVPKGPKDWRNQGYFEGYETFETGMWYAEPNKHGLYPLVSQKMWYVPHFKHRIIGETVLEHDRSISYGYFGAVPRS